MKSFRICILNIITKDICETTPHPKITQTEGVWEQIAEDSAGPNGDEVTRDK
jgi:hypothetical protein